MRPLPSTFLMEEEPLPLPIFPSTPPRTTPKRPLDHFTTMYQPKADASNIYEYSPEELVDKALKTLQDAGIELIEWSSLLYRRMNVPVIIKVSKRDFSTLSGLQTILVCTCALRTFTIWFLTNSWTMRRSCLLRVKGCLVPCHRLSSSGLAETSTKTRACTALPGIPPLPSRSTSSFTLLPLHHIPHWTSRQHRGQHRSPSHSAGRYSSQRVLQYMRLFCGQ